MVVVSHLFFFFQINFREGMTRCESYPPCFGTIYFPIAPSFYISPELSVLHLPESDIHNRILYVF